MNKRNICCLVVVLVFSVFLTSCNFDILNGPIQPSKYKLYESHNEFVKVVKYNLDIPDKNTITYKIENPVIDNNGEEIVDVSFFEDGMLAARAICYTSNGEVSQVIQNYSHDNNQKTIPNTNNNVNNNINTSCLTLPESIRFNPVSVDSDQLLCFPLPFTPLNGFSWNNTLNPCLSATLSIISIIREFWSEAIFTCEYTGTTSC